MARITLDQLTKGLGADLASEADIAYWADPARLNMPFPAGTPWDTKVLALVGRAHQWAAMGHPSLTVDAPRKARIMAAIPHTPRATGGIRLKSAAKDAADGVAEAIRDLMR